MFVWNLQYVWLRYLFYNLIPHALRGSHFLSQTLTVYCMSLGYSGSLCFWCTEISLFFTFVGPLYFCVTAFAPAIDNTLIPVLVLAHRHGPVQVSDSGFKKYSYTISCMSWFYVFNIICYWLLANYLTSSRPLLPSHIQLQVLFCFVLPTGISIHRYRQLHWNPLSMYRT